MDYNSLENINLKELIENETNKKFDRQGRILCPFHPDKTPSLSVRFNSNANKDNFKCFGCGESGDAIDFIIKYKNLNYIGAREYLGLSIEKNETETQAEKIEKYINWELTKYRKGQILLGLFLFVNDKGEIVYFKAKFVNEQGEKQLSYYHLENDKVVNKRKGEELPYNLYNVIAGIKDDKIIVICEGEKDANVLNKILRNNKYVASSVKGVKDLSVFKGTNIYVCGDTGSAGEKYINWIKEELFDDAEAFKIINLPGIKDMGDNKDVTDWLEIGHSRTDLLEAFKRSLDLKNRHELQQDWNGIYKTIFKGDDEEGRKIYIANFNITAATNVKFIDENKEGIKLILKSSLGKEIERTEEVTVFDDLKSFRNFLGSMDLIFKGKMDDLLDLKQWIKRYFAIEDEEIYTGTRFIIQDNQIKFVTHQGTYSPDNLSSRIKGKGGPDIDITKTEFINKDELQKVIKYIFEFTSLDKSYSIIGTVINNLAIAQAIKAGVKNHIILIVGGSGSGKSTILENVIAPILNYPKDDIKSIGLITKFALINALNDGNYPIIFEEHKPSGFDQYRILMLSDILRNTYDRSTIDRGSKNLTDNKVFCLRRPIIIAGEERWSNLETALMERSDIVYLSKDERTIEQTEAMAWIMQNKKVLNKLGKSLVYEILNLSTDEYKQIRKRAAEKVDRLKDRPLTTAINICTGIEILNKLLNKYDMDIIKNYENFIVENIRNEICDSTNGSYTEVEKVLKMYNDMVANGRVYEENVAVKVKDNEAYIRTSEMFNQIYEYIKSTGQRKSIMDINDFKKQAQKSGYLIESSSKKFRYKTNSIWYDKYCTEKLKNLGTDELIPADFERVELSEQEQQVIFPEKFNKIQ